MDRGREGGREGGERERKGWMEGAKGGRGERGRVGIKPGAIHLKSGCKWASQ